MRVIIRRKTVKSERVESLQLEGRVEFAIKKAGLTQTLLGVSENIMRSKEHMIQRSPT